MSKKISTSAPKRQFKSFSKPRMIVLEPRMLFDGAAVATVIDANQDSQNVLTNKALPTIEDGSISAAWIPTAADTPIAIDSNQIEAVASLSGMIDGALALAQPVGDRKELIVVDGSLENLQSLIDNISRIPPDKTLLVLDPATNEADQFTSFLQEHSGQFDAIHVLSHGGPGWISLKDQVLGLDTLEQNAALWNSIKTSLTETGDLLLYGCNVANTPDGQAQINALAIFTGADIAASIDTTGSDSNWMLETSSGFVEASTLAAANWQGDLGAYDAAPLVMDVAVNEGTGSTVNFAVFTVKGNPTATVNLVLTAGTATATTDYLTTMTYWNGTAWTSYTGGASVAIQANSELLVRFGIAADTLNEGAETVTLRATYTATTGGVTLNGTSLGTATILDDGTGVLFTAANPVSGVPVVTAQPGTSVVLTANAGSLANDDRPLTVGSFNVSESGYAVFTVSGKEGQYVKLALTGTATASTDYTASMEYWNGSAWTAYTLLSFVQIPADTDATGAEEANLLVRVAITNDTALDNSETIILTATNTGAVAATGTATIKDDGTGTVFATSASASGVTEATGSSVAIANTVSATSSFVTAADADKLANDDRVLTATAITVNEGSIFAVFTVGGKEGQYVKLALTAGTATASTDYTDSIEFWDGSAWAAYTAGGYAMIPSDGDGTAAEAANLLVRVAIVDDAIVDNSETFTLTATNTGAATSTTAIATIKDDGTGTLFTTTLSTLGVTAATASTLATAQTITAATTSPVLAANIATLLNDDRAISVADISVNEGYGSNYVIFTLTGITGQYVKLGLGGTATAGTDYTNSLEYLVGTTWTAYTADSFVKLASTTLLVRVAISADTILDGSETIALTATNTGTVATTGTATIMDDGTGNLYTSSQTNATPVAAPTVTSGMVAAASSSSLPNDDRPLAVNSFSATESGAYAVFTVTGGAGQYVKLALGGTATTGTDYTTTFQFFDGTTWQNYVANNFARIPTTGTTLLVRVAITADATPDSGETIILMATNTGTVATTGTATIVEDTSGIPFNGALTVDSIAVSESSYAVFTVGGKEGQYISLVLTAGTATGAGTDFAAAIEYWDPAANTGVGAWVLYPAGGYVQIPGDGDATQAEAANILVRVAITNDILLETGAGETFTLTARSMAATPITGTGTIGTATIKDDGTGTVFSTAVTNATASSLASPIIDLVSASDNDSVIVSNVTVNETGLFAVFNVSSQNAQTLKLTLVTTGTGTGFAVLGTDTGAATALDYWDTATTTWVSYNATTGLAIAAGQTISVRTAIVSDGTTEGTETFLLRALNAAGTATLGQGTGTIVEDGSGNTFATITPITLNEKSPYAVFTIANILGKSIKLSLEGTTLAGSAAIDNAVIGASDNGTNDINSALQYWNGGIWVDYTNGTSITAPSKAALLVRVAIYEQSAYEGPETFTLKVTDASNSVIGYGVATIMDNGSGSIFTGDATVTDASAAYSVAVTAAEKLAALEAWRQINEIKSNVIVAGTGGAFYKAENGDYYVTGGKASATGTNISTPVLLSSFNYTGTIIDVAVPSTTSSNQYLLLTTTGLYAWGTEDIGLPTALTTSTSFQRITTPAEFIPADVQSMTASSKGIVFLMKDGTVRTVTASANFTRVIGPGSTALTGITDLAFATNNNDTAAFAYSATTGKFYTWGGKTYLGNGTVVSSSRTTATEMANPLPTGVSLVQIGVSASTYYVLGSDGKVYVCGLNWQGSAGQGTSNSGGVVLTWTAMRDITGVAGTSLTDVQYISAQDSSDTGSNGYDAIAMILKDSSVLAVGGNTARNKLGTTATGVLTKPTVVSGSIAGKEVYTVEVGGFFSAAMVYSAADKVSYSGEPAGAVGATTTIVSTYAEVSMAGIVDPVVSLTELNPASVDLRDDSGITVSNIVVNETSSTYAVFVVEIASAQSIQMTLAAGTATAASDYTATMSYWNGSAWIAYTASTILPVTAGQRLHVRVPILVTTPAAAESNEIFTLNISDDEGSLMKSATATIVENSSGTAFAASAPPVTVSSAAVNEASPFAIFTVTGVASQAVSLALTSGTASGSDYVPTLQHFNGTNWVDYTQNTFVQIPSTGTTLLARVVITNDNILDNSETFGLVATNAAGITATGLVTIKDDGTGNLYSTANTTGSSEALNTNGLPATLDDDQNRPLAITSPAVNEGSPFAVFTITGQANQVISSLVLANGATNAANGLGVDYGATSGTGLEYWNGGAWVTYITSSNISLGVDGTLLVRAAILNDTTADNAETFNLNATATNSQSATGIATIYDDGSGTQYTAGNPTGYTPETLTAPTPVSGVVLSANVAALPNDDRVLAVTSVTVNEASPYAVFKVTGVTGQYAKLSLASLSATVGTDTGSVLQYYDGSAWQNYVTDSFVQILSGGLLVRVTITNDATGDNGETFKLSAVNTGGTTAIGICTINDDGTGSLFSISNITGEPEAAGTNGLSATLDREFSVSSVLVNEGSKYAVFTVVGTPTFTSVSALSLTAGTAEVDKDYFATIEYWNGTAWVAYSSGSVSFDSAGILLVRTLIFNDNTSEISQTFRLNATSATVTVSGTATIMDDGTGTLFLTGVGGVTGVVPSSGTTRAVATLDTTTLPDDDLAVRMNDIVVNEYSPYAVFTLDGGYGTNVRLSLSPTNYAAGSPSGNITVGDSTASNNDINSTIQYWSGTAWLDYSPGSVITIPAAMDGFVRVDLNYQSAYEGPECFTLTVTDTNGIVRGSALATIMDDGTGSIHTGELTPTDASAAYASATTDAEKAAALAAWRASSFEKSRVIISSFHDAFYRAEGGGYYVSGESATSTGVSTDIPILVAPENGYNYTGEIIDVGVASIGTNAGQYVLLTTDGVYVWGVEGRAVEAAYTSSKSFQKITSFPTSFVPSDAQSMSVGAYGISFLMKNGEILSEANSATFPPGHPSGLTLNKVVDINGAAIQGITDFEYNGFASFAYSASSNKFYTWGNSTYLGNGSAALQRTYAVEMANPVLALGVSVVQIGVNDSTYFVLGSDGKVYVTGKNASGVAGQNSITAITSWTTMRDTTGNSGTSLANVQFISAAQADANSSSFGMILKDGSVLVTGSNSSGMLGLGAASTATKPTAPTGSIVGQKAYAIEVGGHFSSVLLYGCTGEISATGHNPGGAFGDASTGSRTSFVQTQFLGALDLACLDIAVVATPSSAQLVDDTPVPNDPPVDGNETNTVTEDTSLTVTAGSGLLANATDPESDTLTITGYTIAGVAGTQTVGTPVLITGVGTLTINADGSYSFAPALNYTGAIPVATYTISDGNGGSDSSTLTLTITPIDDLFADNSEVVTTSEDTPISGTIIDIELSSADGPITLTGFLVDTNNDAVLERFTAGQTAIIADVGSVTIASNGTYTFTPVANWNGTVPTVIYELTDDAGITVGDTSTLDITVIAVNDAPVDSDETNIVTPDITLLVATTDVGGLLHNYRDTDRLLPPIIESYIVTGIAGRQAVDVPVSIPGIGTLTIQHDGAYVFTPETGYFGIIPVVTYTVDDGNGGTDTSTLTLRMADPLIEIEQRVVALASRRIPTVPYIQKPFEQPPLKMGRYEFNTVVLDFNGAHGGINQFSLPYGETTGNRGSLQYSNHTPYIEFDRVGDEVQNAQRTINSNAILSPPSDSELRNPVMPPDARLDANGNATYILPPSTFVGGKGDIKLTAYTKDGKPLPDWIKFNPVNGKFEISMPQDAKEPVEIQIIGTDSKGDQAKTKLNINPSVRPIPKAVFIGKASLTSQIQSAVTFGRG